MADARGGLWLTDVTHHLTGVGWVYIAVVVGVLSRRVVGWSIPDI